MKNDYYNKFGPYIVYINAVNISNVLIITEILSGSKVFSDKPSRPGYLRFIFGF